MLTRLNYLLRGSLASLPFALCFFLSGCEDTPTRMPEVSVDQCTGNPTWCIEAVNAGEDTMEIRVDGTTYGYLGVHDRVKIPVSPGPHVFMGCYQIKAGLLQIPTLRHKCDGGKELDVEGNSTWFMGTYSQ